MALAASLAIAVPAWFLSGGSLALMGAIGAAVSLSSAAWGWHLRKESPTSPFDAWNNYADFSIVYGVVTGLVALAGLILPYSPQVLGLAMMVALIAFPFIAFTYLGTDALTEAGFPATVFFAMLQAALALMSLAV